MADDDLGARIRGEAPRLFSEIDPIAREWLEPLLAKLEASNRGAFRPKQVNDPVWGTIELMPWEVALVDTPMLQRLRGVRQLGLANLVFPSASHSRLEHVIGVIGAVEAIVGALRSQIERWNRDAAPQQHIPQIDDHDRFALRMAALFHDTGHGPFSHASEPIFSAESGFPEGGSSPWREDLQRLREALKTWFSLNDAPALSEVLALAIVYSEPVTRVLRNDAVFAERLGSGSVLQERIAHAIVGSLDGPHPKAYLSAVISSQIDADRIDYLSRDAHHAALVIGFDTDRLLARLEVLRVTEQFLDDSATELRQKVSESPHSLIYQIGIAASGFGSFEQMLIGRTFLYDRLYHHHKIRAAEAMAQRLMLAVERDRGRRFSLSEMLLPVSDETLLEILAGRVQHPNVSLPVTPVSELASSILKRELFHRAFAFRARFIAAPPGLSSDEIEQNQRELWIDLLKELDTLQKRHKLGVEIYEFAIKCKEALGTAAGNLQAACDSLTEYTPDHIIIDFPGRKAEAIRILARYPNGQLRVPEFSFNPVKWADAYDLQKRTSYVFAPKVLVPLLTLASKVIFLRRFGVAMAKDADGFIKSGLEVDAAALAALERAELIDQDIVQHLTSRRQSLIKVRATDLNVPEGWVKEDPDLPFRLVSQLNKHLKSGLTFSDLSALGRTLKAIFAFVDNWHSTGKVTDTLANERALQGQVKEALGYQELTVIEGAEMSGGESDLYVENAVIIENKFEGSPCDPKTVASAAGMQGRRYAIALNSQLVIVILAYPVRAGELLSKPEAIEVRHVAGEAENRVQIRFYLPYGAPFPSREKAAQSAKDEAGQ